MSRHHMLPPIIYTPQPKPKKIENRKSRIQVRSTGAAKAASQTEETEETSGVGGPRAASVKQPLDNFAAIEGSERKPWSTTGRLSEETLKAMLAVQEGGQ